MGERWYVVHTQAQGEARAEFNLRRQGFTTYLPRYLRTRRHARRTDTVARPLFPRYLFVALDMARDRWRSIQSSFGVSNLLAVGNDPLPLPEGVMDQIRAREDGAGLVQLGLPPGIRPGSPVRLLDGMFTDYRGEFERSADAHRVTVLLELLGRHVRVCVPAASVGTA
jgi:transcriptional antiterminator RfaH